jgi:hypothetical protein
MSLFVNIQLVDAQGINPQRPLRLRLAKTEKCRVQILRGPVDGTIYAYPFGVVWVSPDVGECLNGVS